MSRLPAAKRREQLLDCAAALFAERGYARATTAELARAAGVTEPIIYRHFKSKRDLFIALIERTGKQTIELWRQDLANAADPAQRLKTLIGDNPMVSQQGRDAYRVFLQAITEVDDDEIHKAWSVHIHSLQQFLAMELARAQENRRVTRHIPAELIAWLLIDIGLGYGVLSAMRVEDHNFDATGDVHVQQVITRILVGRAADAGDRDEA
ncbi:MAG: TetR/AcrR family transcriptional regulator [Planctomycetota bacterium]|nr:MAG: TetR/AcrR family transcriptional regulator [Planctomycetota bacterium]